MARRPAHPIIVLWTTPRSRSTAFERMMVERGDHHVVDEPFSARYYFSPERRSDRFTDTLPASDGASVVAALLDAAERGPVFVKDMAYHATGLLTDDLLACFHNTFLVRDPAGAIASFARRWPDLTDEEAGYARLAEAFDVATKLADGVPPVVEADDLAGDPPGIVAAWCHAVGLDHLPRALTWKPGMIPQWTLWRDWYETAAASTGFTAPSGHRPEIADPRLRRIVEEARPIYDRLAAHRLRPASTAG